MLLQATMKNNGRKTQIRRVASPAKSALIEVRSPRLSIDTEFSTVRRLVQGWQAACGDDGLPPYEDVALNTIGRLADETAVIRVDDGITQFLRTGERLRELLSVPQGAPRIESLPTLIAQHLSELVALARHKRSPVSLLCRKLVQGAIQVIECVVLPLSCRWRGDYYLLFARERENTVDLAGLISEATQEGVVILSPLATPLTNTREDFHILSLNRPAAHYLGGTVEQLVSHPLSEALRQFPARTKIEPYLALAMVGRPMPDFEMSYTLGGAVMALRISVARCEGLLVVTMTDIRDIKARETLFHSLFDENAAPMMLRYVDEPHFMRVNRAAVRLYGYERDEFLHMGPEDIVVGPNLAGEEIATQHKTKDGRIIDVVDASRFIDIAGRRAILATIVDMTERKRAEAHITYLAHHDPLTGAANRAGFTQALDKALSALRCGGAGFALMIVDLDDFKAINDRLGHDAGDAALVDLVTRLRGIVRSDDVVARLGGDEFALILHGVQHSAEAETLAGQLIAGAARVVNIKGHALQVGASIGIALAPHHGDEALALMKCADIALYKAKNGGKRTFRLYEERTDLEISQRRALEHDIRMAAFDAEFELFYQPIMAVRSEQVVGFEALMRWRHPERGMVSPSEFIVVAEQTGVIHGLGLWALRKACEQALMWPEHLLVAVNVSPVQFNEDGFVEAVAKVLRESGLAPHRLEIEITETVLLAKSEANIAALNRLRALGVRVALDDFGQGYSAMGYLLQFSFSRVKLDRTFIKGIPHRMEAMAIIEAISGLCARLHIDMTAEGVENEAQLEALKRLGCREVQGFYFSRPVPADDTLLLISNYGQNALAG